MKLWHTNLSPRLLRWGAAGTVGIALYEGLDWLLQHYSGLSLHGMIPGFALGGVAAVGLSISVGAQLYQRSTRSWLSSEERRRLREISQALDDGQIRPYFQPVVDPRTGHVVAAEALARWVRTDGRLVPPGQFIPLTERAGCTGRLTRVIAEAAVEAAAGWHQAGLPVPVSVNLSALDLVDRTIGQSLVAMCRSHGLPERLLRVELTETQAVSDIAQARIILSELRAAGIGVLVDDFGTGFASMSMLHDLPFSGLKIDRQFVQNVPADRASAAIVRASVELARQLGLTVIAEGVEDAATATWLQRQGIDRQQGFLYAPALPARELLTFSALAACREAQNDAVGLHAIGA